MNLTVGRQGNQTLLGLDGLLVATQNHLILRRPLDMIFSEFQTEQELGWLGRLPLGLVTAGLWFLVRGSS